MRPLRSWVERDVLGGLGETLQRLHRGACDQATEQRGERDAADHRAARGSGADG